MECSIYLFRLFIFGPSPHPPYPHPERNEIGLVRRLVKLGEGGATLSLSALVMQYDAPMRVEWIYDNRGYGWNKTMVQLWRMKGSAMVFAPVAPYEGVLLDHSAGEVQLVKRGLWRAVDETGREHGTAASPAAAAELLPRVQRSLDEWRRPLQKGPTTP